MAVIKASVDETAGLTTLKVSGKLEVGELQSFWEANMDGRLTDKVLLELRDADMSSVVAESLQRGVRNWSKNTKTGDRMAFVFSHDLEFGIGRMIQAFSQIAGYKSQINIFRDMNEATKWLLELQPDPG